ncbi:MAG: hypothetical protein WCN98_09605, partial [Verrucomicrobiaceae bacterium]
GEAHAMVFSLSRRTACSSWNIRLTGTAGWKITFLVAQRTSEPDYYKEFLAEREEIQRYKWIKSQKEARDIGFERALAEWVAGHREIWRTERQRKVKTDQRTITAQV